MKLDMQYLTDLEDYISSGRMAEDFEYSAEERRYEMLDFLEKLMELGETADGAAAKILFKGSLGNMMGGGQKGGESDGESGAA